MQFRIFLILWVICISSGVFSQTTIPDVVKSMMKDSDTSVIAIDTLKIQYFELDDLHTFYEYKDTTLGNFFHQYDPLKRQDVDYLNLGNAGSASRPIIFDSAPYIGYSDGFTQYHAYNYTLGSFRFYENNIPFSDVSFTPMSSQENFVIRSDFSRSFDGGTALSLNYQRIRQIGFYTNQLTKNTNFGTSLRVISKNKRYTGFISMISNVNEEGQNGGILVDTLFGQPLYNERLNIPVTISDGQTRHQQKQYSIVNYYQLNDVDNKRLKIQLRYDFVYDRQYHKYTDEGPATLQDSTFYGDFLTEDRGVRFYNSVNGIKNAIYAYVNDGRKLNIRGGIIYDRKSIQQQSFSSAFDNVMLDFSGDIPVFKGLSMSTVAKLGLLDAAGDFYVKGSLGWQLGSWIDIQGGLSLFRYTPPLIYRSLVLNDKEFWANEFAKPVGTELFATFKIPFLRISGQIKQSVINNVLYFDNGGKPKQLDEVLSASSLQLSNELRFGKFGLDNVVAFQIFSDNVYRLPSLFSKHNVYVEGLLFKRVLLARLGVETRLMPSYKGASYFPVVGNFGQSEVVLPFYPMTDVYFVGKIQKFRLFLRLENIVNLWNDQVQFQTDRYPQFDFKIRFGVRWLLVD